ncbi:MAG: hypothetical protein MK171_06455 [Pirellulales bacterium]|nr:hypothetical protein [Pirellulales bacterium]
MLWLAAFIAAGVAIGVPKFVAIANLPVNWALICGALDLVLGFFVAGIWRLVHRPGDLDAAVKIDLRYGLKERVASSLSLSAEVA